MRMITNAAIGEAPGGFQSRHYELNWRRDRTHGCAVTGSAEVYSNVPSHVIPAMRAASGYRLANNDA